MLVRLIQSLVVLGWAVLSCGCLTAGLPPSPHRLKHPIVTARPAKPKIGCPPTGIPFYLPKPLLVVSKNFHHVNEHPYGLTTPAPIPATFDDQSDYAKLNNQSKANHSMQRTAPKPGERASVTDVQQETVVGASPISPGLGPVDGLAPITFFTYEIVFVPDLTQKYALDVSGGAGEFRAAMNLINGWQFTGLGPFYMKDSSTAQNLLATGVATNLGLQGTADVLNSVADLTSEVAPGGLIRGEDLADFARAIDRASQMKKFDFTAITQGEVERYAEIHVYEPFQTPDGTMQWREIVGDFDEIRQQFIGHRFDRTFLGSVNITHDPELAERALDSTRGILSPNGSRTSGDSDGGQTTARTEDIRQNISVLPRQEDRSQLYQNLIDSVRPQPKPKAEPGLLQRLFHHDLKLFHRKRGSVENSSVSVAE